MAVAAGAAGASPLARCCLPSLCCCAVGWLNYGPGWRLPGLCALASQHRAPGQLGGGLGWVSCWACHLHLSQVASWGEGGCLGRFSGDGQTEGQRPCSSPVWLGAGFLQGICRAAGMSRPQQQPSLAGAGPLARVASPLPATQVSHSPAAPRRKTPCRRWQGGVAIHPPPSHSRRPEQRLLVRGCSLLGVGGEGDRSPAG